MKLRSQPEFPRSFDWVHNLTMNLTPEGVYQAVHVRNRETDNPEFAVLFQGSREQCAAYMEKIVRDESAAARAQGRDFITYREA